MGGKCLYTITKETLQVKINLAGNVQDLYKENYKPLLKDIKKTQVSGKTTFSLDENI